MRLRHPAGPLRFLDITPQLPALLKEYGDVYQRGAIPASAYKQPADVPTVVVPNVLLVKKGFDPELARKIVNVLLDHQPNLVQVNPAAKEINAGDAPKTTPLPLNPGAKAALANRIVEA